MIEAKRSGIPIRPHTNEVSALSPFGASKPYTTLNIVKTTPNANGTAAKRFFMKNFIKRLPLASQVIKIST
jgi:hypothetical protein